MATVTFNTSVGGDGTVISDDNNPTTGLAAGGHRVRFVPALTNVVNVAQRAVDKAAAAETSAVNANNSAVAAAASYDSFDDRYLGPKASNPTLDNDGAALLTGALHFNTTANEMRVWNGSAWATAYLPAASYATLVGVETLTNKSLQDSTTFFVDETDTTKKVQLQVSGVTTGTTRVLSVPDANTTLVGTDAAQTLTNKTLTAPAVNGYTEGVSAPAIGAAFTLSLASQTVHALETNGNATITLPSAAAGKSFQVQLKYGGAHSVTWAVPGGTTLAWPGATAPVPTSTTGKTDIFNFVSNAAGTIWFGATHAQNY